MAEEVASWQQILKETYELEDVWRSEGSTAWYRGHADATWELKSTLHRHSERMLRAIVPPPSTEEWRKNL
jgi:hypothetical protein